MKRKLLSLGLFAVGAMSANAQVFSETFDTEIPSSWTIHDVDGLTSTSGQSAFASFAWNSGTQDASSSSWYDNNGAGPTNDWLVSPGIAIPASGNFVLEFFGSSHEANYLEEYEVLMTTAGTAVADFAGATQLIDVVDEAEAGTNHSIALPASALGQTIYIAFHHTSQDESMLHIDNVVVRELLDDDIELMAVTVAPTLVAGAVDITGTVRNNGANAITSFDVDWNDGTSHSQTITANIASGATYNFTHPTQLTAVAGTSYNITTCATVTNDGDANNNCISTTHSTASGSGTRLTLVELWTSSTCPPCQWLNEDGFDGAGFNSYNTAENANAQTGAGLSVIKYQVDWPSSGDHSFNADVDSRVSYYAPLFGGSYGAPQPFVDGDHNYSFNTFTSADVNAKKAVDAFVDITATHTFTGNSITVNVDVDPYANYSNAVVHIALLDKEYNSTSDASFSNGETEFHHVLRKLMPTAGNTVNLVDGTTSSVSESYTFTVNTGLPAQGSFDLHSGSDREVVVFVQAADGTVLNSAISTGATSEPNGINDEAAKIELNAYPNPTNDIANVKFNLTENADVAVELVNALGQTVAVQNLGSVNGEQVVRFNTNDLQAGIYLINVNVNGVISTKRLSVTK